MMGAKEGMRDLGTDLLDEGGGCQHLPARPCSAVCIAGISHPTGGVGYTPFAWPVHRARIRGAGPASASPLHRAAPRPATRSMRRHVLCAHVCGACGMWQIRGGGGGGGRDVALPCPAQGMGLRREGEGRHGSMIAWVLVRALITRR